MSGRIVEELRKSIRGASMINIVGDRMEVKFDRFDLDAYETFLRTKKLPESDLIFDPVTETYSLAAPARFASLMGVQGYSEWVETLPFPVSMFDRQRDVCMTALKVKRFAAWWDCGLGKTFLELEFARQAAHITGGRGLILTLKELIPQFVELCAEYYPSTGSGQAGGAGSVLRDPRNNQLELRVLKTRAELIEFCKGPRDGTVAITNYEKFIGPGVNPNDGVIRELKWLSFLVADESSILKSGGGVIKWNLIKSARGIEYKLSCTATPAPNDIMEYASQAGFLEKLRSEGEILWTYFKRNAEGVWEVKPHALEAFYRFMASWSIYLRNPAAFGWKDHLKSIPEPVFIERVIPVTAHQLARARAVLTGGRGDGGTGRNGSDLLAPAKDGAGLGMVERTKLSQLAKGFIYLDGRTRIDRVISKKPGVVAEIALAEVAAGRQVLIWTQFDEETAILSELLAGASFEVLTGSVKTPERRPIIERFKRGRTAGLITRAELLGFGQNFQNCEAQIWSGFTDSYEDFYQAVRRSYRYGQTKSVRIFIPYIAELEGAIRENLMRKAANFERDTQVQERYYLQAMRELKAA